MPVTDSSSPLSGPSREGHVLLHQQKRFQDQGLLPQKRPKAAQEAVIVARELEWVDWLRWHYPPSLDAEVGQYLPLVPPQWEWGG